MFRSSILQARLRISTNVVSRTTALKLVPLNTRGQFRRYKSTEPQINEIQNSLPSIDDLSQTSSTILDQVSSLPGELSNQIGYLNSIGLAQTWHWPADIIQHCLEYTHVYTGMPWWGTICTVTVLIRLLLFPLYVKSSDTVARNSKIKPELDKITKDLMETTDLAKGQMIALKRKKLLSDNGVKTRWLFAPILQMPIALGFFNGLRNMANFPVDGFGDQGAFWFQNLSMADPYLGLQLITAAVFMGFTRLGGETGAQQFSGPMKRVFVILPLLSIPATMKLSSAVVLYFAVNGFCSVVQTLILRNKWIRSKLKIFEVVKQPISISVENKGIMATLKENAANAKAQSRRKQEMYAKQKKLQDEIKQRKDDAKIRIVRRSELKD
ncbi:hypothetical protein KAFR_0B02400 [Kazachstania africana CBS 2517]|uniref:Membrane insertase YidC/Oxa/ALB C-terminal domain-containing protein n=1 Tax=Kazachstania africana (strain ATCC 22294 / BCRC 22015 / CBS 2517 / CECT 1963 / NBRC 1671 / NRRL Y-8276) TaxID=1071382 RepID=H2AQ88_KAZAF|nr:hypothetical protein KAFR_0B02400 [Kazachstania africana CBS 2517]CCF56538.1 hypothetical protein KAFR_0B02400 [Kazachstania africana CBS 2517]